METQSISEYHHYIPRFILYRFAIDPPGRSHDKKQKQKLKRNAKVKAVDLTKNHPKISTAPVARVFGETDMYKDRSKATAQQMHVEKKLFEIERDVGVILAKIFYAYEDGMDKISLLRCEKDLLCKFAFISRYRGPIFFERFNHQTADDYNSNDRKPFLEYMKRKNFKRPLDVWFDNLTKVIDIPMDPSGKWVIDLARSIYPGDVIWISLIMWSMHLVFVTPSNPNEEFILTENAFGIHEGPSTYTINPSTSKRTSKANTEFHLLHVISPRLAMILRDNTLPEPTEDKNEELRAQKSEMLAEQARRHFDPAHARSMLHDLPVARARCSNPSAGSRVDALIELPSDDASAADTFEFPYFRLASDHVQTINSVMLDQAHTISKLVFRSETALRKAVEFYLEYPTQANGGHSRKTISGRKDDPMLLLFQKLEKLVHSLGSDVEAKYYVDASSDDEQAASVNRDMSMDDIILLVLKTAQPIRLDIPLSMATQVMLEVISKSRLNIVLVHALDLVAGDDGRPSYPEIIYSAVQNTNPIYFNQYTKALPELSLPSWEGLWDVLVKQALLASGADMSEKVEEVRVMLAQAGYSDYESSFSVPLYGPLNYAQRTKQNEGTARKIEHPLPSTTETEFREPTGLSKRGLRNALEDVGRTIENEETRPSRPTVTVETRPKQKDNVTQLEPEAASCKTIESIRKPRDKKLAADNSSLAPVETHKYRTSAGSLKERVVPRLVCFFVILALSCVFSAWVRYLVVIFLKCVLFIILLIFVLVDSARTGS